MSDSASLKVALVGPTHPYKGGVAAHTTALAHELAEAGHDVTLVSWSHLYPSALYPGEQAVPGGSADVEPFPRTLRVLSWARPDTWVRAGRRLRDVDVIVVVHVIPAVVPAHLALLRAAGVGRTTPTGHGPRTVVIAHNVLPHEGHPGDRQLMEALLRRVDAVVVHSDEQARLAAELGAPHVRELDLPPHLPGGPAAAAPRPRRPARACSRWASCATTRASTCSSTRCATCPTCASPSPASCGGMPGARVRELAADPRLAGRVEVHGGYVPADRIPELMAHHDVVALTYRTATASQNALLALSHGLPVLASAVGTFAEQVRDGVDGLLVPPSDRDALVAALRRLAEPGVADRLRAEVRAPDLSGPWAHYVGGIEALAAAPVEVEPARPVVPLGPVARARATVAGIRARRGPVVDLAPSDIPERVRATDLLAVDDDARDAVGIARALGLPRPGRAGRRLVGAGRARRDRAHPRRRAPVVGHRRRVRQRQPAGALVARRRVRPGRARAHRAPGRGRGARRRHRQPRRHHPAAPRRLHAADVDHAIGQASWALRSGGLLVLTVPIGDDDPEFAVRPAGVRGILARADDLGLRLVGDVDGDVLDRMRDARTEAAGGDAPAYAVLRLTFRRR